MVDRVAGHKAGAATVLLANEENEHLKEHHQTGQWIYQLDELIGRLEEGFDEGTPCIHKHGEEIHSQQVVR